MKLSIIVRTLAGCALCASALVAPAATYLVRMSNYQFSPATLSINAGDTVIWTNVSGVHTATSDTGVWDSGYLNPGGTYSFTFNTPGTYPYNCIPHRSLGMVGTIYVVQVPGIPRVRITSPANPSRTTNASATIRGTASDNSQVTEVRYELNGGPPTPATGTTAWEATVTLLPGTNVFRVYAIDDESRFSPTNVLRIYYAVLAPVTVETNGPCPAPAARQLLLEIGRNYTFTAGLISGFRFIGWTGSLTSSNRVFRFMMDSNVTTLVANYQDIQRPFIFLTSPLVARTTNRTATIRGRARDPRGCISEVSYSLNSGPWTPATGTSNWEATLTLLPGVNTIRYYAVDLAGNTSLTNRLLYTYIFSEPPVMVLSPTNVTHAFCDTPISFTISNIANGVIVRVDKYLDANRNGLIDPNEPLVQRFSVREGRAAMIGGVRNRNMPGDDDGQTNAVITGEFYLHSQSEVNLPAAHYLYRATSPVGRSTAEFAVEQLARPDQVSGSVLNGTNPVPYAFVFAAPVGEGHLVAGTLSDSNGNFSLSIPPDETLRVGAMKSGLVFNRGSEPYVRVSGGQTVNTNLSLTRFNRTISGRLTDARTGLGIAGVQIIARGNNGGLATAQTLAGGTFAVGVNNASTEWSLEFSEKDAALQGYVNVNPRIVTTGGGSVSGLVVSWNRATALLYGTVERNNGDPVTCAKIYARRGNLNAFGFTAVDGSYTIGVNAGSWVLGMANDELQFQALLAGERQATAINNNAVRIDLVPQAITGLIQGQVHDTNNVPIPNVPVAVTSPSGDYYHEVTTDAAGNYSAGIFGGTWVVVLPSSVVQRHYVGQSVVTNVTDGVFVTANLFVRHATSQIRGTLRNLATAAIANVGIYATGGSDGIDYRAWTTTDSRGRYVLPVFDGMWDVCVSEGIQRLGYNVPACKSANVPPAAVRNFVASPQ